VDFVSILETLSMPATDVGVVYGGWDDVENIQGIKWHWSRSEIGAHDLTWKGTLREHTTIKVSGTRTMITNFILSTEYAFDTFEGAEEIDLSELTHGVLEKVTTHCDINDASEIRGLYRFTLPEREPLYILHEESFGTRFGTISYSIAYRTQEALEPLGFACEVVN